MDILNFISWIKGGRVVTTVDPAKTLIPVGLKDDRRDDGYLAGAITVEDLAVQVGGLQTVAVDGITITGDGTLGDPLVAAVPTASYKVYSALLTQTGTAAPVVTVVTNTLGTVTIARDNPGRYSVTTSGLFTTNKTIISVNTITTSSGPYGGYAGISDSGSTNVFYIDTAKVIGGGSIPGVGADNVLFRTPLEIKVYN